MASFVGEKTAYGVLEFPLLWADWLDGDTLTASTWTAETGLTIDRSTFTDTLAVVWLKDGVLGKTYTVTNRIETALGRKEERAIDIVIVAR